MNRDQARNLVRDTFTQAFDKARFRTFAINVLNHLDEAKAQQWNTAYIKDAFKDHVARYERLGTYTAPAGDKLDVLIVHLTAASKLERARTAIRNFVADHLKTRDAKEAALVAFVSPTEKQWRFSYVKMEYATVEKESGQVGVEQRLTPARRYSYIVGEGESCHTAQTRFLALLGDTETNPALSDIEEAFSVEAVTKEFFTKYVELFDALHAALEKLVAKDKTLRDEFHARQVGAVDFAKKLLGQIVFLYFLQKKGWLGVAKGCDWGTGPHDFLRQLAADATARQLNFFNDVLEPLFYDTLATDRGHDAWCRRFQGRIPFLNGGLFEPLGDYDWQKTDITLPNQLFTTRPGGAPVEVDDDGGTGVLDVFDRYNFTVNEAEPLEKEVAIDPEMLGKVFENLIEENRRKGLGAFYTPREIVHYMCQESLINYLDTALNSGAEPIANENRKQARFDDAKAEQTLLTAPVRHERVPRADLETFIHLGEQISHYEAVAARYAIKMPKSIEQHARELDGKLADITVCDPAVGSGAFPVGMMTELVRARCALTPYFKGSEGDTGIPAGDSDGGTDIPVGESAAGTGVPAGDSDSDTDIPVGGSDGGTSRTDKPVPATILKTRRNLPHWTRDGAIYWITFRLADSLPQEKLTAWKAERESWISQHPEPWSDAVWKAYDDRFGERLQTWLDAGHGSCLLARPEIRQVVQECLLRFDGDRLRLHAGVIMPNHVHLLLEPLAGHTLSELLKGIKGASSHKVRQKQEQEQTGMSVSPWKFWMDESYDHIVRSAAQYQHFLRYIAANPVKAQLSADKYWLECGTDIPVCGAQRNTDIPVCESLGKAQAGMPVPRTPYHFKRHAIQSCLYGVDIDPGAIEIAKLRLWLSLVVDEEETQQIKPLPNLLYKIVAGNSLLGVEKTLFNAKLFRRLEELKPRFFDEPDKDTKARYKQEIEATIHELTNGKKDFDFEIYFSEVFHKRGGFDITIGNPPYVRADVDERHALLRKAIIDSGRYETLWEKWDLYVPFIERAFKLLRPGGVTTMIVSDAFCHSKYAQKPQNWFLKNSRIIRLDFCSDLQIFEAAVHNVIYFFQRANGIHHTPERRVHSETFGNIATLPSDAQAKLTCRAFFPEDGEREKFRCKALRLESLCYISKGMVVSADEQQAQGAFRMEDVISDSKDTKHPKRFAEGKHLNLWLPATHKWLEWGTRRAPALFSRPTFPELHEAVEKILVQRSPGPDPKCCYDDRQIHFTESSVGFVPWHLLHGVRNNSLKKTARYRGEKPRADLPKREELEATSRRFAVKYLLGVMNSAVARDFLRANRRSNIHLYPDDWKQLLIPDVAAKEQAPISSLVDRILAAKRRDPDADMAALEREIDQLVYALYGLTADEIKLVEGGTAR